MEKIYELLKELRPEFDYHSSHDFVAEGLLDSFDIITLVIALEDAYGIIIDALDILPEHFCSVEAIAYVVRKSGGTL